MMCLKRLFIFGLFAVSALAVPASITHAAKESVFSYQGGSSSSFDFGSVTGYSGSAGGKTEVFDVGFNAGAGLNALGCAGVSLDAFMNVFANLERVFDNFLRNLKQALFRRLLVEAFSRMPQIGALFDTMNALGNARFEMFTESCDIDSISKDAKQLVHDRCVSAKVASGKSFDRAEIDCSPSTASRNVFDEYGEKVSNELREYMTKIGIVPETMRNSLCSGGKGEKGKYSPNSMTCGVMSFLPQMRLCFNMGGGQQTCAQNRYANAPVSSAQLLNTVWNVGHKTVKTGLDVVRAGARAGLSRAEMVSKARSAEAKLHKSTVTNTAQLTPSQGDFVYELAVVDYQPAMTSFGSAGKGADVEATLTEFRKFLHCSAESVKKENTLKHVKYFAQELKSQGVNAGTGEVKKTNLSLFNYDADQLTALENTALGHLVGKDAKGTAKLIDVAVQCVMNQYMHISLGTYIDLVSLSVDDQEAYASAAASRMSFLVTELIMRFMKQKVLQAHVQVSSGRVDTSLLEDALKVGKGEAPSSLDCEQCKTPQPVLDAIKTIADMFENQIQALNAVKNEQDSFAKITAKINEKRRRMQSPTGLEQIRDFLGTN